MEKKGALTFTFSIVAIILGLVLFKHFDFKNATFKNPPLDIIYAIVFIFSIYFLVKNSKSKA